MKLEIGQKLYSEIKDGQIETHIVSKIGNKYFEVENKRERYVIESLCSDSEWVSSRTQLYLDDKELENKIELRLLMNLIRSRFNGYGIENLTLDQARKIKSILEEK